LLSKVEKVIRYAGNALVAVGGIIFIILMFLGASDVIGRYVFDKPIFGAIEISEAMMAGMVMFSWAYTQRTDGHVRVELFISHYSPRVRAAVTLIGLILSLGLFVVITQQGMVLALQNLREHRVFPTLGIPAAPVHFFIPVGAFFICLQFMIQIIRLAPEIIRRK
jgi:TRAP-type C4-dicarboxylate transport system permease small subunit